MNNLQDLLNPIDIQAIRDRALSAQPFPHFYIDNFLKEDFANEVHDAFPDYDTAIKTGRTFNALNEVKKVQITDPSLFPPAIEKFNNLLLSKEFVDMMSEILDIPDLISDPNLTGGGIHETREGGRLDVHVDFNFNDKLGLFRRVNILIYFNKDWKDEYGGILDLWDEKVEKCYAEISPVFNRMACFVTSEISYHGVTPLKCPKDRVRKSFAAYYYSANPHKDWDGSHHTTIFKARPTEWVRGHIEMPLRDFKSNIINRMRDVKKTLKDIFSIK